MRPAPEVSIPFIAGQWSLRSWSGRSGAGARAFQSPSLRGSGRFADEAARAEIRRKCFNPLHCGAVVASCARAASCRACSSAFQSPSLRGSGRFGRDGSAFRSARRVSIPFIAGQWSLPAPPAAGGRGFGEVSIPFIAGQWSLRNAFPPEGGGEPFGFNPLHCGAVVAS